MNRAELFAKYFNGDFDNCCHIFEDGLILVIACSEGSHEQITQTLMGEHPNHEAARSQDGFASVFVLPSPTVLVGSDNVYGEWEVLEFLPVAMAWTDCKLDHRLRDDYTLDHVMRLLESAEQQC